MEALSFLKKFAGMKAISIFRYEIYKYM